MEFLSQNEKGKKFSLQRSKAKEKKLYLKKNSPRKENVTKIKKLGEGKHRSTMAQREEKSEGEREKQNSLKKLGTKNRKAAGNPKDP